MSTRDMTFGESPMEASAPRAYRAVEGQVDRISIIFFQLLDDGAPDLTRPRVLAARTQYHSAVGTVLSRADEPGADQEIWGLMETARERYATLVLKYPTDAQGRARQEPAGLVIVPWDYGEITQKRLHDLSVQQRALGRNLGEVDLLVRCTQTRKQFIDVSVAGPAAWRTNPNAQQKLLDRALAQYGTVRVGRELADADLRVALGLPGLSQQNNEVEVEDLIDLV